MKEQTELKRIRLNMGLSKEEHKEMKRIKDLIKSGKITKQEGIKMFWNDYMKIK